MNLRTTTAAPLLETRSLVSGIACPKRLWWATHEPAARRSWSLLQDQLEAEAEIVKVLFRERSPHGVQIGGDNEDARIASTRAAIDRGETLILDGTLSSDSLVAQFGYLRQTNDAWEVGAIAPSTTVEPELIRELAAQVYVLRSTGLVADKCTLVHLNPECRYPDLDALFLEVDVTAAVEKERPRILRQIFRIRRALKGPLPMIVPGDHCRRPRECLFLDRCAPEVRPDSLDKFVRMPRAQVELLQAKGYQWITELPDNYPLTLIQRRQQAAIARNRLVVEPTLRDALPELSRSIAIVELHAVRPAVPIWTKCRPFEAVPGYITVLKMGVSGGSECGSEYREWLSSGQEDPRAEAAEWLSEMIRGEESILMFDAERNLQQIRQLVRVAGCESGFDALSQNRFDLQAILEEHVYDYAFLGSFELLRCAEALVPDLYVGKGTTADAGQLEPLLARWMFGDLPTRERGALRQRLSEAGRTRSYLIGRVLNRLSEICGAAKH
ncbi:DUF2779 domain-containing protein [bacterium]|nr:DUF2779 domain-containing protein [bacterium]